MAIAMSIFWTLYVLVSLLVLFFLKIPLPEMLIPVDNEYCKISRLVIIIAIAMSSHWPTTTTHDPPQTSNVLSLTSQDLPGVFMLCLKT